jgi:hypothetical protein
MKRNLLNDDEEKLISSRKKLKFGVDTILGNVNTHSDNDSSFETTNDSDDELRHKGKIFQFIFFFSKKNIFFIVRIHVESPVSTSSSVYSSEHFLIQPSYSLHQSSHEANYNQGVNFFRQMPPVNYSHHLPNPLWRPTVRPFIGKY